jgi:putative transposase
MSKKIIRAIRINSYASAKKRRMTNALISRYRAQVNLFIEYIWNNKNTAKLDANTLAAVPAIQNLSQRYKSAAHRKALALCSNKMCKTKPVFNGFPVLDAKFVDVQHGRNSFDLYVKLSTLQKGKPIYIPSRKHKQLNKWLAKGKLLNSLELRPDGFILFVELEPKPLKTEGLEYGIDIGMNKLIATSYGETLGTKFNELNTKIWRKQKNSKNYKKALKEKRNYINRCLNELPLEQTCLIAYENLTGLKSKKKRSKKQNKQQQYWSYRHVINGLKAKAQENRIRLVYVSPAYTSQKCSACGNIAKASRKAEIYNCVSCGISQDADVNGAKNILQKSKDWIGSLKSPVCLKRKLSNDS